MTYWKIYIIYRFSIGFLLSFGTYFPVFNNTPHMFDTWQRTSDVFCFVFGYDTERSHFVYLCRGKRGYNVNLLEIVLSKRYFHKTERVLNACVSEWERCQVANVVGVSCVQCILFVFIFWCIRILNVIFNNIEINICIYKITCHNLAIIAKLHKCCRLR